MNTSQELIYPRALHQRLEGILSAPLSLLMAGSGFGKTTAVSHYLNYYLPEQYECHFYTCFDEPPQRSWSGICRLLAYANQATASCLSKLDVPMPDMLGYVAQLMDGLSCEKDMVLVIDNYQLANFPAPNRLIEALSMHRSRRLHLVIVTQPIHAEEPLKAFQQTLHLIDQSSFSFSPEDICALYQHEGIALPFSVAQRIYEGTGGWISALMLQIEYTRANGIFAGPGTVVLHELIERCIWRPLNESQRQFLIYASLLNDFTHAQAAVLLDKQEIPAAVKSVIQSNPFIRANEHAYIMHSLLREYLQEKFSIQDNARRCLAWSRAGRACLLRKQSMEAVQFLIQAGEAEEAFRIPLTAQETKCLMQEQSETVAHWLSSLSDAVLTEHLEHLIAFGLRGGMGNCIPVAKAATSKLQALLESPAIQQPRRDLIRASLELAVSFQEYNDVEKMVEHHKTAWELAGRQIYRVDGEAWTFCAPSVAFMYWRESGTLDQTCVCLEEGIHYYSDLTGGSGAGSGEAMRAEFLLLAGDEKAAVQQANRAVYVAEKHHQDSIAFCARVTLCRAAILQGDKAAYRSVLDAMNRCAFHGTEYRNLVTLDLCKGFLDYILEWNEDIPQWLDSPESIHQYLYPLTVSFAKIIYARKLRREDPERFLAVVEEFMKEATTLRQLLPQIYFLLEQAVCHEEQGAREAARACVERALCLALPDSVYLPFAERYAALEKVFVDPALRCADEKGIGCILRLGRKFSKGASVIRMPEGRGTAALTEREREIALLAKQQLSTKEIAGQLMVSTATVKNTLNKVYAKLNVRRKSDLIQLTF